jgi:putative FmdB family regulatory protein
MPIYAYKCSTCQHMQDVLQKLSDAPLAVCPECGAATFTKQLTAAGFQLKGSGWYATDFKNGPAKADTKPAVKAEESAGGPGAEGAAGAAAAPAKESAAAPAPAAPAGGAAGGASGTPPASS